MKIHRLADVQSTCIGDRTSIWQFCVVLKGAKIGNDCNINCNVFIENDVLIGNSVTIKPGVQIWDGITIEDEVFIGPNVTFTNDLIPRSKNLHWELIKTVVREGASIGANSTILAGIDIGSRSLIGAGSVVTTSVGPFEIWYGNPAKHKGYITLDGNILDLNLIDKRNGNVYQIINNRPVRIDD